MVNGRISKIVTFEGNARLFADAGPPHNVRVTVQCVTSEVSDEGENAEFPDLAFRFIFIRQPRVAQEFEARNGLWRVEATTTGGSFFGELKLEKGRMAAIAVGPFKGSLVDRMVNGNGPEESWPIESSPLPKSSLTAFSAHSAEAAAFTIDE